MLLVPILVVILIISITALIIAADKRNLDINDNSYVKFPLLQTGTSFYNGLSIGVSANDNFSILYDYTVDKDFYIGAFYHDDSLATGGILQLSVSKDGGSFDTIQLTNNFYDLYPEVSQTSGSSFQYRFGKVENFTRGMCFTLQGLNSNTELSTQNNFTALLVNSDFDSPFKILSQKGGKNFSSLAFGSRFEI